MNGLLTHRPAAGVRFLAVASLMLGLSILYQVYLYDFQNGVLKGGELQRLLLKVVASLLFMLALRPYLSREAFRLNLALKLPLLFVAATIFVVAPFLAADNSQALNLFFFLPVLLIDWNRLGAAHLYRTIWAAITGIVVVQLVLDPILKFYTHIGWDNAAVIGGMGNPNVFGIFLVVSGLATWILLPARVRFLSPLLFMVTPATGSLAAALIGGGCLLAQGFAFLVRAPGRTLLVGGAVVAALVVFGTSLGVLGESGSLTHAFGKLLALGDFLSGSASTDSQSISVRMDYLQHGVRMLTDSPLSLLVGHPGGVPMYNGDGLWVSFVVTYGLPVTLAFLLANLVVVYRAMLSRERDLVFSGFVVAAMLAIFVTNRILDYWPAALVYLLAFSYLTNKGVRRRASPATAPASEEHIE